MLKKAQCGTAVPCGMGFGYLDESKIVGNANSRWRKEGGLTVRHRHSGKMLSTLSI